VSTSIHSYLQHCHSFFNLHVFVIILSKTLTYHTRYSMIWCNCNRINRRVYWIDICITWLKITRTAPHRYGKKGISKIPYTNSSLIFVHLDSYGWFWLDLDTKFRAQSARPPDYQSSARAHRRRLHQLDKYFEGRRCVEIKRRPGMSGRKDEAYIKYERIIGTKHILYSSATLCKLSRSIHLI